MLLVLPLGGPRASSLGTIMLGDLFTNSLGRGMGEPTDATCPATLGDHEPPLPGDLSVGWVGATPGDLLLLGLPAVQADVLSLAELGPTCHGLGPSLGT